MLPPQDLSGHQLGQYHLIRLLGEGGMGAVYEAEQLTIERTVAVKVLRADVAEQEGYIDRFKREVKIAATLQHPHILPVHDFGVDKGISFIAMRLVGGGSLADNLKEYGVPPLDRTLQVLKQLTDALGFAHQRGVVHRDLKPANILFDELGNAYLTDFGIAKVIGSATKMTKTGMMIGTPAYMSPEQWHGYEVEARTDLYALGIITYELLADSLPFVAQSTPVLMNKHINEPPDRIALIQGDAPESLKQFFTTALAKAPEERHLNAQVFFAEAEAAIHNAAEWLQGPMTNFKPLDYGDSDPRSTTEPPPPPPLRSSSRRPAIMVGIGLLAVVILIGVLIVFLGGSDDDGDGVKSAAQNEATETLTSTATEANVIDVPSDTPESSSDTALPTTQAPSETPTTIATATNTIRPIEVAISVVTLTLRPTATNTATQTPSPTNLPSITPTSTPSITSTFTPIPSITPSPTVPTDTPTSTNTATPTQTLTMTPTPTITLTPTPTTPVGHRMRLFYDENSLYLWNPMGPEWPVSPLTFEPLDASGFPTDRHMTGAAWTQFYGFVEPNACMAIEITQETTWLRPRECQYHNARLNPPRDYEIVFWVQHGNAVEFRVLWQEQEIARCPIATEAHTCDIYAPE